MNFRKNLFLSLAFLFIFSGSLFAEGDKVVINDQQLEKFVKVPLVRQSTSYTCGVASMQSVLFYYGDEWREDKLAQNLKTTSENGTNYKNMLSFAKSLGYETSTKNEITLEELKKFIDQKRPVIVPIQAWSDKPADYKSDWEDGHYVVVAGYDKENFYFMDPSTLGHYTYISAEEFDTRWHDMDSDPANTKLIHFGVIIYKEKSTYKPGTITKLE